jgi:hypothetical protein
MSASEAVASFFTLGFQLLKQVSKSALKGRSLVRAIATSYTDPPKFSLNKHNPIPKTKAPIPSGNCRKALLVKNQGSFRTAKLFC